MEKLILDPAGLTTLIKGVRRAVEDLPESPEKDKITRRIVFLQEQVDNAWKRRARAMLH